MHYCTSNTTQYYKSKFVQYYVHPSVQNFIFATIHNIDAHLKRNKDDRALIGLIKKSLIGNNI